MRTLAIKRWQPETAVSEAHNSNSGEWVSLQVPLTPRYDRDYDRVMIGIVMNPLRTGPLPVLPGEQNALVNAGLQPGDSLIAIKPQQRVSEISEVETAKQAEVIVAHQAQQVLIPLTPEVSKQWRTKVPVSALSKMFGASQRPAPLVEMVQARLVQVDDQAVVLQDMLEGKAIRLSWQRLGPDSESLINQLQRDDIIAGSVTYGDQEYLSVIRGGEQRDLTVQLQPAGVALGFDVAMERMRVEQWHHAFGLAWNETSKMISNTAQLIPRFFSRPEDGGVDASKSLHGPVGIFREMKARAERFGFASFLQLVAMLGINLFLLNLLPIPLVDGGRLLFIAIEAAIRRPLPAVFGNIMNLIGLGCILLLMVYVLGLDILRLLRLH